MDMQETLKIFTLMLVPAFFSLLGMAALGSPAIALLGEVTAKVRKKVFFDKYGQQTGAMGLRLTLLLFVIYAASAAVYLMKTPENTKLLLSTNSPLFLPLATYAIFTVVGIIYFLTWKKMREFKIAHIALGAIAAMSALACVTYVIHAKLYIALTMGSNSAEGQAKAIAMASPMSIMFVLLCLAAATALSTAYLVLRRNKDDFGRDYYNFGLTMAARWAVLPMIGFLGCQGWLYSRLPETIQTLILSTPLAYVWAGLVIIGVLCIGIWMAIAKNESPLRLKGLTFVSAALMWLMHSLNVTLFMSLMSMI